MKVTTVTVMTTTEITETIEITADMATMVLVKLSVALSLDFSR
jgi:hypothetical protein